MSLTGHTAPNATKSRIANSMGKARILMDALPYIQEFKGKTFVIKYGGSAMVDDRLRHSFAGDVALLASVGIRPIVVHGGGPAITTAIERAGLQTEFVDGLRVTDSETIKIVQTTLAGTINPDIVRLLTGHGALATGLTGFDGGLLAAEPVDSRLGFVGEICDVNVDLLSHLLDGGVVPVIAPLARDTEGVVYNVNADTAAGAIARAVEAEKLVYLTDVEGLYRDFGDHDSLISRASIADLQEMADTGAASKGMRPKVLSIIEGVRAGVHHAHILDGRIQHALLLEIFTREGIGTMVMGS